MALIDSVFIHFDHEPRRILAKIIEPLIWTEVERLFLQPEVAKSLIEEAQKVHQAQGHVKDADRLRSRVRLKFFVGYWFENFDKTWANATLSPTFPLHDSSH